VLYRSDVPGETLYRVPLVEAAATQTGPLSADVTAYVEEPAFSLSKYDCRPLNVFPVRWRNQRSVLVPAPVLCLVALLRPWINLRREATEMREPVPLIELSAVSEALYHYAREVQTLLGGRAGNAAARDALRPSLRGTWFDPER
jgi:hypothetical protein